MENGKNLFDIKSVTKFYYGITTEEVPTDRISISNGLITNTYGGYGRTICFNSNITKLRAGTYTLSADVINNDQSTYNEVLIGVWLETGEEYKDYIELDSYQTWQKISYTFSLTNEAEIHGFCIQITGNAEKYKGLNFNIKNIQLEEGSTATEYKPYDYGVGDKTNLFNKDDYEVVEKLAFSGSRNRPTNRNL